MKTIEREAVNPGDTIQVDGSKERLTVLEVHDDGLHLLGQWHRWVRWADLRNHQRAS